MAGSFGGAHEAAAWLRAEAQDQAYPRPCSPGMIALRATELRDIADMLAPEPRLEQGRQIFSGAEYRARLTRFGGGGSP